MTSTGPSKLYRCLLHMSKMQKLGCDVNLVSLFHSSHSNFALKVYFGQLRSRLTYYHEQQDSRCPNGSCRLHILLEQNHPVADRRSSEPSAYRASQGHHPTEHDLPRRQVRRQHLRCFDHACRRGHGARSTRLLSIGAHREDLDSARRGDCEAEAVLR